MKNIFDKQVSSVTLTTGQMIQCQFRDTIWDLLTISRGDCNNNVYIKFSALNSFLE
jgi:hypothetical protein